MDRESQKYEVIAPPFTLDFRKMKPKELEAYFNWFLSVIPERIKILTRYINSTTGFEDWRADLSPESLSALGEWLSLNVEARPRTDAEKEQIYQDSPDWFRSVEISDTELTIRSFSLAIDTGMYMSEVFLFNYSSLRWQHYKGRKNDINHGQPVLAGFGPLSFNPVQIMVTLVYGLADKTNEGGRLRELYDIWSEYISKEGS